MTLLNASCAGKRATISVDSIGGTAGGDRAEHEPVSMSKMLLLPHSNILLAGRGVVGMLYAVFNGFLLNDGTFDQYSDGLSQICTSALVPMREKIQVKGLFDGTSTGLELVMAGWSDRASCMAAVRAVCNEKGGFDLKPVVRYYLAPGEPWEAGHPARDPSTADDHFAAAKKQLAWWKASMPQFPVGGRLVIAEMTRYSTHFSSRSLG